MLWPPPSWPTPPAPPASRCCRPSATGPRRAGGALAGRGHRRPRGDRLPEHGHAGRDASACRSRPSTSSPRAPGREVVVIYDNGLVEPRRARRHGAPRGRAVHRAGPRARGHADGGQHGRARRARARRAVRRLRGARRTACTRICPRASSRPTCGPCTRVTRSRPDGAAGRRAACARRHLAAALALHVAWAREPGHPHRRHRRPGRRRIRLRYSRGRRRSPPPGTSTSPLAVAVIAGVVYLLLTFGDRLLR